MAQLSTPGEGLRDIGQVLKDGVGSKSNGPMVTGLSEEMLENLKPAQVVVPEKEVARSGGLTSALAKMLEQRFERLRECVRNGPEEPERILARLERAKRVYDELMNQVGYGGGHGE